MEFNNKVITIINRIFYVLFFLVGFSLAVSISFMEITKTIAILLIIVIFILKWKEINISKILFILIVSLFFIVILSGFTSLDFDKSVKDFPKIFSCFFVLIIGIYFGSFYHTKEGKLHLKIFLITFLVFASLQSIYITAQYKYGFNLPSTSVLKIPQHKLLYNYVARYDICFNGCNELYDMGFIPTKEDTYFKTKITVPKEYENTPMEFRVWYAGRGFLKVDSLSISKIKNDNEMELIFQSNASKLPSKVGISENNSIIAKEDKSTGGYIIFGPYIRLSTGSYEISLKYSASGIDNTSISPDSRPTGTFTTPLHANIIFLMAFFVSLFFLVTKKINIILKILMIVLPMIIMLSGIIISSTRGSFIGLVAGFFVVVVLLFYNRYGIKAIIIGAVAFMILYYPTALLLIELNPRFEVLLFFQKGFMPDAYWSISQRFDLYQYAINGILDNPVLGHGLNTFWVVRPWGEVAFHAHNNYLQMAYTSGIIAMLIQLAIDIICIVILLKNILNKSINNDIRIISIVLLGLYIAFISYGLSDFIYFGGLSGNFIFILIGFIVSFFKTDIKFNNKRV